MNVEATIPGLPWPLVQQICEHFKSYPEVTQVILFGSRAKGNYRPNSDIDLCLEAAELSFSKYLQLADALDDLVLPYSLDLALKHQIDNPDLLNHIERVGVLIYHN